MTTKMSIFIAIIVLVVVSSSMISFFSILNVNAQTENTNSEYSLSISKDATSGLIVTDGASYVNGLILPTLLKEPNLIMIKQEI